MRTTGPMGEVGCTIMVARKPKRKSWIKFLAVMVPYRESEPEPQIVPLKAQDALGFRVADTEIAVWWGTGPTGKIAAGTLSGDGRLIVKFEEGGKAAQVISK